MGISSSVKDLLVVKGHTYKVHTEGLRPSSYHILVDRPRGGHSETVTTRVKMKAKRSRPKSRQSN